MRIRYASATKLKSGTSTRIETRRDLLSQQHRHSRHYAAHSTTETTHDTRTEKKSMSAVALRTRDTRHTDNVWVVRVLCGVVQRTTHSQSGTVKTDGHLYIRRVRVTMQTTRRGSTQVNQHPPTNHPLGEFISIGLTAVFATLYFC